MNHRTFRRAVRATSTLAVAATLSSVGLLAGSAGSALALGEVRRWNSAQQPLTVTGYRSTGQGHGTWKVSVGSDGTRSRLSAQLRLRNSDNHRVFAHLTTQTDAGYCHTGGQGDCQFSWADHASATTQRHAGSAWKPFTTSTGVNPDGQWARARVRVQIDVPWRKDPASNAVYTARSSY